MDLDKYIVGVECGGEGFVIGAVYGEGLVFCALKTAAAPGGVSRGICHVAQVEGLGLSIGCEVLLLR